MTTVSLPIIHTLIFAALLMLSWVSGSIAARQNFQVAITVHQQLVKRFEELQQRYDRLVADHDELQSQKWQMDGKFRELLREIDRLSAELHHYKNQNEHQNPVS